MRMRCRMVVEMSLSISIDEIEMHVPFVDFSPPRDPHPIPRLKIYPHFRALLPFPPLPLTPLAPQFKFTRERIN
jgi:hypothetical protein